MDGGDGYDAIECIEPDLIILELKLSGIGGFEILTKIKQDPLLSACKILVMSAFTGQEEIDKAFELGADDYVKKPFILGEVSGKIDALLESKAMTPEMVAAE